MSIVAMAATDQAWCLVVPHHARGAGLARRRLAHDLAGLIPAELLADSITVVAELVGNAVRHAAPLPGDVVRVAWRLRAAGGDLAVEVRVTDGGADQPPTPRQVGPEAIDGRGLAIIDALAQRWGVIRDGLGQCVWAELCRPVLGTALPLPSE
jgi:anti-sigma regulatory factor (Ser/Thr protein kinase)